MSTLAEKIKGSRPPGDTRHLGFQPKSDSVVGKLVTNREKSKNNPSQPSAAVTNNAPQPVIIEKPKTRAQLARENAKSRNKPQPEPEPSSSAPIAEEKAKKRAEKEERKRQLREKEKNLEAKERDLRAKESQLSQKEKEVVEKEQRLGQVVKPVANTEEKNKLASLTQKETSLNEMRGHLEKERGELNTEKVKLTEEKLKLEKSRLSLAEQNAANNQALSEIELKNARLAEELKRVEEYQKSKLEDKRKTEIEKDVPQPTSVMNAKRKVIMTDLAAPGSPIAGNWTERQKTMLQTEGFKKLKQFLFTDDPSAIFDPDLY